MEFTLNIIMAYVLGTCVSKAFKTEKVIYGLSSIAILVLAGVQIMMIAGQY